MDTFIIGTVRSDPLWLLKIKSLEVAKIDERLVEHKGRSRGSDLSQQRAGAEWHL